MMIDSEAEVGIENSLMNKIIQICRHEDPVVKKWESLVLRVDD